MNEQKVRDTIYPVSDSLYEARVLLEAADFIALHDDECKEREIIGVLNRIVERVIAAHEA